MSEQLKRAVQLKILDWPTPQEYNEAIQNLAGSMADEELAAGSATLTAYGLPRPITGAFASVYRIHCGHSDWAVRCFLYNFNDQRDRYARLSEHLAVSKLPYIVPFKYMQEGIRLHGRWYPVLKMKWAEGQHINQYVERNLAHPERLTGLALKWKEMAERLGDAGIAHGDLQHGNVLVSEGEVILVDYDGMFVPSLSGLASNEIGHRNYQHPARGREDFGPYLDHFSAWVIFVSIVICGADPGLWRMLNAGDECMLFRQSDFTDPLNSKTFYILENHEDGAVRNLSRWLRFLLSLPLAEVPNLATTPQPPSSLPAVATPARGKRKGKSGLPDWMDERPSRRTKKERGAARRARRETQFGKPSGQQAVRRNKRKAASITSKAVRSLGVLTTQPDDDFKFSGPYAVAAIISALIMLVAYLATKTASTSVPVSPTETQAQTMVAAKPVVVSEVLLTDAGRFLDQGDYSLAAVMYRRALLTMEKEGLAGSEKYANTLAGLASCLYYQEDKRGEAAQLYLQAYNLLSKLKGADSEEVANVLSGLGEVYMATGQYEAARSVYTHALSAEGRLHPNGSAELVPSMVNLASAYQYKNQYKEAEKVLKHALKLAGKEEGGDSSSELKVLYALKYNYEKEARSKDLRRVNERIKALTTDESKEPEASNKQ